MITAMVLLNWVLLLNMRVVVDLQARAGLGWGEDQVEVLAENCALDMGGGCWEEWGSTTG